MKMDCSECDGHCCRCQIIQLLPMEIEKITRKYPTADIMKFGKMGYFKSPCQFQGADNKCKIYADRPIPCKMFPFYFQREKDAVLIGVWDHCPKWKDAMKSDMKNALTELLMLNCIMVDPNQRINQEEDRLRLEYIKTMPKNALSDIVHIVAKIPLQLFAQMLNETAKRMGILEKTFKKK